MITKWQDIYKIFLSFGILKILKTLKLLKLVSIMQTKNMTYHKMITLDILRPDLTLGIPDQINPDDALLECKPQYSIFFRNNISFTPITFHLLRTFVKSVFNAQNFNNLLFLKRWSFISFLNNFQAID